MNTESKRKFIIDVVYLAIIAVIAYFGLKYLFNLFMPFLIGFFIAFALMPVIKKINKMLKTNNKIISIVILILFYAVVGFLITVASMRLGIMLKDLFNDFPRIYVESIEPFINSIVESFTSLMNKIDPSIMEALANFEKDIMEQLTELVKGFSKGALNILGGMVTSVPSFLLSFIMTIISSFFITIDYKRIVTFMRTQLDDKTNHLISEIKNNVVSGVLNFIKAYSILLGMTFIECTIGLSILGVNNAIAISVIVALVDIMPVLGTGTIMIPWAIIELFNGDMKMAIGLAILYVVITVVRQITEPRVVGESLGIYPLLTLISMFVGVRLMGGVGLLLFPIIVTVVIKLQNDGIINIYKLPGKQEAKNETK